MAWPAVNASRPPDGLTGVTAIALGDSVGLALKEDGAVVAWGRDQLGQARAPADLDGVIAIAAGNHGMALTRDEDVAP